MSTPSTGPLALLTWLWVGDKIQIDGKESTEGIKQKAYDEFRHDFLLVATKKILGIKYISAVLGPKLL